MVKKITFSLGCAFLLALNVSASGASVENARKRLGQFSAAVEANAISEKHIGKKSFFKRKVLSAIRDLSFLKPLKPTSAFKREVLAELGQAYELKNATSNGRMIEGAAKDFELVLSDEEEELRRGIDVKATREEKNVKGAIKKLESDRNRKMKDLDKLEKKDSEMDNKLRTDSKKINDKSFKQKAEKIVLKDLEKKLESLKKEIEREKKSQKTIEKRIEELYGFLEGKQFEQKVIKFFGGAKSITQEMRQKKDQEIQEKTKELAQTTQKLSQLTKEAEEIESQIKTLKAQNWESAGEKDLKDRVKVEMDKLLIPGLNEIMTDKSFLENRRHEINVDLSSKDREIGELKERLKTMENKRISNSTAKKLLEAIEKTRNTLKDPLTAEKIADLWKEYAKNKVDIFTRHYFG